MASGHVNRARRPNTWPHRPSCKREENPCQRGAVHTWHIASFRCTAPVRPQLGVERTCHGHGWNDANDAFRKWAHDEPSLLQLPQFQLCCLQKKVIAISTTSGAP